MTDPAPVLRPACLADASAIFTLSEEVERVHREQHPELFRPEAAARIDPGFVERSLSDPNVGLLVAALKGVVLGFVRVVATRTPEGHALTPRSFARVDEVAVAVHARRQGIGKLLLAAAEGWARAQQLPAMEVTVWAFNEAASELYEKQGFSVLRQYLRKEFSPV